MLKFYIVCSIRRLILQVLVLVVLPPVAVGAAPASEATAATLFRLVEERFASLQTLSYTVKRTVTSKRQRTEDQWLFQFKDTGAVRIEYQLPSERLVIVDDKTLIEYIPALKKAMKTDLSTMAEEKKKQTVMAVLGRVAVEGLRLGTYAEMEKKAVKVKPAPWAGLDVYLVEGADPRYAVYIDRAKRALIRTEIYDKGGKLQIRTEASRFVETAKDFWMPQEILTTYNTAEGFVQSKVVLRDIRVNDPLSEDAFRITLPRDVEVIPN